MAASSLQQPPPISINDLQTLEDLETETETKKKKPQVDLKLPYGDGSSSSKSSKGEVFKVYFKGLLGEERVNNNNNGPSCSNSKKTVTVMTMAGIGVAICDWKDEMIFELRKPLKGGDRMCRRSVEGQALIEALKAAISLELNRIVLYYDNHPLYQYVSGRWRPKQQKIRNLLDQVNLLRKSFTHCEHSLIACKDVKFAFKLAREAINAQITEVVSSQEKLENCVICLDDKSRAQFFSHEGCTHRCCYSCVKRHVEVKLLNGVLPKCPHEGCGSEFRFESCAKFLNPKFTEMMRQQLKEDSIPVTEKVYCPYPKCSTLMSKTEALRLINDIGAITCFKCNGSFCINCNVPWHERMNCAEYKRRNPIPIVEESNFKNLAARNLWRQCIKCKHMIELAAGCYHITCRCGYEFCYTCGAEWKDKKATCTCPLWDEEHIVDNVEEDDEDGGFIGFEDDVFGHDVVHEDEGDDFEHDDVLEDEGDDFEHDDVFEGDDFEHDDVLEDEGDDFSDEYEGDDFFLEDESDDFEHDFVLEDEDADFNDEGDDFEHDVAHEDKGDDFEHDVALEDKDDDFERDVVLEDEDADFSDEDDVVLEDEGDDFNDDDDFEQDDVLEDEGDDFNDDDDFEQDDVLEDEGDDFDYDYDDDGGGECDDEYW